MKYVLVGQVVSYRDRYLGFVFFFIFVTVQFMFFLSGKLCLKQVFSVVTAGYLPPGKARIGFVCGLCIQINYVEFP